MSIQPISTAFIPASELFRGKVSPEKGKAVFASNQVQRAVKEEPKREAKDINLDEMAKELNKVTQSLGSELSFSVDSELNQVIVTVTDLDTKEVIRQIPSEEMIALAKRLREMESGGDARGLVVGIKG